MHFTKTPWRRERDSNPRPSVPETDALSPELPRHYSIVEFPAGIEPAYVGLQPTA